MALTDRADESEDPLSGRLGDLFTAVKGPPRPASEVPPPPPGAPGSYDIHSGPEAAASADLARLIRHVDAQLDLARQEARQGLQSVLSAVEELSGRVDKLEAKVGGRVDELGAQLGSRMDKLEAQLRDRDDATHLAEARGIEMDTALFDWFDSFSSWLTDRFDRVQRQIDGLAREQRRR